jgi:hypothetical protein
MSGDRLEKLFYSCGSDGIVVVTDKGVAIFKENVTEIAYESGNFLLFQLENIFFLT